jgi:hypothetical protein
MGTRAARALRVPLTMHGGRNMLESPLRRIGFESNKDTVFEWLFHGGRLTAVRTTKTLPNVPLEIGRLEEVYGKPTDQKTVQYGNAYGAKWDCLEATWAMPDGAEISAKEQIENLPTSGPTRVLTIRFASREDLELLAPAPGPNPYK